jgi:hypothetical protein
MSLGRLAFSRRGVAVVHGRGLTPRACSIMVRAMNGPNQICGIRPEIIR